MQNEAKSNKQKKGHSSRPSKLRRALYVEIDRKTYEETGELIPLTGEVIDTPVLTEKVPRGDFEIVYTNRLFSISDELGNKAVKVFNWMLKHKDGLNYINYTQEEIAKATETSRMTVSNVIKVMIEKECLLRKRGGRYLFNPSFMVKGNQNREAYIMTEFLSIKDEKSVQEPERQNNELKTKIKVINYEKQTANS